MRERNVERLSDSLPPSISILLLPPSPTARLAFDRFALSRPTQITKSMKRRSETSCKTAASTKRERGKKRSRNERNSRTTQIFLSRLPFAVDCVLCSLVEARWSRCEDVFGSFCDKRRNKTRNKQTIRKGKERTVPKPILRVWLDNISFALKNFLFGKSRKDQKKKSSPKSNKQKYKFLITFDHFRIVIVSAGRNKKKREILKKTSKKPNEVD